MELPLYELQKIVTSLEKLSTAGIVTDSIIVGNHRVSVRYDLPAAGGNSSQWERETGSWVITDIQPYQLHLPRS